MKKTKVLSLVLAAAMFCTLFTGCFGGKTIIKVGGNAVSEDIYVAGLSFADSMFQQNYGFSMKEALDQELADGKTGADMLREQADNFFKEIETVKLYAKEKGIKLTAEDKKRIAESKKQQIEAVGGRKAFLENLEKSGANEAFFDYITEGQELYSKLIDTLCTGEGEFAPSLDEAVEKLKGYARVKHVLVLAKDADADFADKKKKAEDVLKRARAGEDFEALIKDNGEDPGMESMPEGYVIDENGTMYDGSGTMVEAFTKASHATAVNAVSDIVKSDYGFHIIKRYPLDKEYIEKNIDTYSKSIGTEAFMEALEEKITNIGFEKTGAYDKLDLKKIFKTEENPAEGEADGDHEDHDHEDHDHDANAEGAAPADGANAQGGIEEGKAVEETPAK